MANESGLTIENILHTCYALGFKDFNAFQQKLLQDHMLRLDQIGSRMLDTDITQNLPEVLLYDETKLLIDTICHLIFKSRRVILMGSIYAVSLAIEMQTDFITLGKTVIQYHHYDQPLSISSHDVILFISATGHLFYLLKIHYTQHLNIAYAIIRFIFQENLIVSFFITKSCKSLMLSV